MDFDDNPFRAPAARVVDDERTALGTFLPEGRLVPAGRGYHWLLRGWELFRVAPGTWIGIAVAFMVVIIVVSMIPLLNVTANLLIPVFIGGICVGCRSIEQGQGLRFVHLFAGFSCQPGRLLLVGMLYLVALLVLAVVFGIVGTLSGIAAKGSGGAEGWAASWTELVSILAMVLVFAPLAMAVWLAPPLVVFNGLTAWQAVRTGLVVALRNFPPFLVFGILVVVASMIASLPLLLGWLLLLPVLYASIYAAYRDLFFSELP